MVVVCLLQCFLLQISLTTTFHTHNNTLSKHLFYKSSQQGHIVNIFVVIPETNTCCVTLWGCHFDYTCETDSQSVSSAAGRKALKTNKQTKQEEKKGELTSAIEKWFSVFQTTFKKMK